MPWGWPGGGWALLELTDALTPHKECEPLSDQKSMTASFE